MPVSILRGVKGAQWVWRGVQRLRRCDGAAFAAASHVAGDEQKSVPSLTWRPWDVDISGDQSSNGPYVHSPAHQLAGRWSKRRVTAQACVKTIPIEAMPSSLSGTVLKKKWNVGAFVGRGGCAEVYEASHVQPASGTGQHLVVKIAPLPVGLPPAISKGKKRKKTDQEKHADMIYYEYTLYKGFLLDHGGVVEIPAGGYGEDQNLRYLVMTRLGPDVEKAQQEGSWNVPRKAGYARQMLKLLRCLHEKCKMVFVDVKPENFMFGYPGSADEDKIFLIDFGLSVRYTGPAGSIKPQSNSAQVQGTPEFLSLKCHGGASAGRCDDLESLGYVILSMLNGGPSPLPWSGSKSVAQGLATKKSTSVETLCTGCPKPMLQYMTNVRGMDYEDTPDYDALEGMLKAMENDSGKGTTAKAAAGKKGSKPAESTGKPSGSTATSKTRATSSKGAQSRGASTTSEVDVCVAEVKDKSKGKKTAEAKSRAPAAAAAVATTPKRSATRRSRRLSPEPPNGDGREEQDFFDARQEQGDDVDVDGDGDDSVVVEVTASKGRARKAARGTSAAVAASTAKKAAPKDTSADKPFTLEVTSGPHEGKSLRLLSGGEEVRVGRNAPKKNGLRLDKDFEVSDKHSILHPKADGIHFEDLGSLNGSFVNEEKVEGPVVLKDGDVLQLGQSVVEITR